MGLKHLKAIENEMRINSDKAYSKTELRDTLKIDYQTVLDVLAYFLTERKIEKTQKAGEVEKYQWKS